MIILGINAYHAEASACIVINGKLIAAAEEERFLRIKHYAGFPMKAIQFCLCEAGIKIKDVDWIAVNRKPIANILKKARYLITREHSFKAVVDRFANSMKIQSVRKQICSAFNIDTAELKARLYNIEHHQAHIASSFFVSPFKSATVVSIDGFGDFVSTKFGEGNDNSFKVQSTIYFPHSLGIFYLAVTQYLGFNLYGDEYKVMGLAPYGKPLYLNAMRDIVQIKRNGTFRLNLDYFLHHSEGVSMVWDNRAPYIQTVYSSELEKMMGPARKENERLKKRHLDIAASLQMMYEEALEHILNFAFSRVGNPLLCLAGGCALNSVANGKIFERTCFKELFIQPAAGDAGGAIGAAFYLWHQVLKNPRSFKMTHAFLGPKFSNEQIASLLKELSEKFSKDQFRITEIKDEEVLCAKIAERIESGKVVGWFQGRMEFGPRSLGNRSILCDPRRADMKDILNKKIKQREGFRPFAPSIVREAVAEWFEMDYDVPFMQQVYQIRPEKQELIPAVTHVDGSGRLHTVSEDQNSLYYRLIKAFEARTGVPLLLNTSFNENEPIVCSPEDALYCFLRTKMDLVVLGNWVIEKNE